ncbi:hypothetical protein HN681_04505 [archaeon]|jgi:hypothetical protein|nr:hypothetical protein [archaeon]MBT3731205.1 hypothetical protein [archaeon]MBT4670041.1 hypothetical protein [archaeon]MBT5287756.1 hypothetical protein [archaeon]MBT7052762.1 hypothetical protein [archaeon]
MGEPIMNALFSSAKDKEKTEEEIKKEKEEKQEKFNPFKMGPGKVQPNYGMGRSLAEEWGDQPNAEWGHKGAFNLHVENFGGSIEKYYYFFQDFFTKNPETKFGLRPVELHKLKDVFDAAVSSSFHGQIGTKVGAIQQQVSTYLSQIGQLTKTLLPLVRELRMMDERMQYYVDSFSEASGSEKARQSEVALKSTWIEVVEQGMQNPNSIYAMANKIGFVTLPDLFFGVNPHGTDPSKQKKRLHKYLGQMAKEHTLNTRVQNALEKKLVQYYQWKEKTWFEMQHTKKFRLKNMQQHYNVIRLYTSWLKPYLTTLKALQMKTDIHSPDMVMAFETSKLELELLAVLRGKYDWYSCIMVRMEVVSRPEMIYTQGGQRQPAHGGKFHISIEPYLAHRDDIDWYKKHVDKAALKTVSGTDIDFSESIENVLGSLGSDVEDYLYEAEHGKKKEEKKQTDERPELNLFGPFKSLADNLKILSNKNNDDGPSDLKLEAEKKDLAKFAMLFSWILYDVFKKLNGMITPP